MKEEYSIIIGGSGKLGRELNKVFLESNNLIITGRELGELQTLKSQLSSEYPSKKIEICELDYNSSESVDSFIEFLETLDASVICVVNTAAGFYKGKFEDMDANMIGDLIDSNFKSIIILVYKLIPILRQSDFSDFINISSISSATDLNTERSSVLHIITKSATGTFFYLLGKEMAKENIRFTTIAPSTFKKEGRVGVPISDVAKCVKMIVSTPKTIQLGVIPVINKDFD